MEVPSSPASPRISMTLARGKEEKETPLLRPVASRLSSPPGLPPVFHAGCAGSGPRDSSRQRGAHCARCKHRINSPCPREPHVQLSCMAAEVGDHREATWVRMALALSIGTMHQEASVVQGLRAAQQRAGLRRAWKEDSEVVELGFLLHCCLLAFLPC